MSNEPKRSEPVPLPPRTKVLRGKAPPAGRASSYSMRDRRAKAMTKLIASFGPAELAGYEQLKQMRMKKRKRR